MPNGDIFCEVKEIRVRGMGRGLPFQVDWSGKARGYQGEEPFQREGTANTKALRQEHTCSRNLFKEQQADPVAGVELTTSRENSRKWS